MADDEGTPVAKGKHVVPKGVAVEELDGWVRNFKCPLKLTLLLKCKGARQVYDHFVAAAIETRKTRNEFGFWKDAELNSVLDLFRDKFAESGIKVALCKRCNANGRLLWLEFIDTSVQPGYVPQYDVANMSRQTFKMLHTALQFPIGVAVKELWPYPSLRDKIPEDLEQLCKKKGRVPNPTGWLRYKKFCDKIPKDVEQLLKEKGLMGEYRRLVQLCIDDGLGDERRDVVLGSAQTWDTVKLVNVVAKLKPRFRAKGVDIFTCYIRLMDDELNAVDYRWLEFVDLNLQPNYYAQRDATTHGYPPLKRWVMAHLH